MTRTSAAVLAVAFTGLLPATAVASRVFTTIQAGGDFSKRVRIPKSKTPKRYTISARCGGGNLGVTRKLRVLAPLS